MADIELAIKIDEDTYKDIKKGKVYSSVRDVPLESVLAIANGTPLPKGHGRLVDLDQMCEEYWDGNYMEIHSDDFDNIKTIIEADREG